METGVDQRYADRYAADSPTTREREAGRCEAMCVLAGRMLGKLRRQRRRQETPNEIEFSARVIRPSLDKMDSWKPDDRVVAEMTKNREDHVASSDGFTYSNQLGTLMHFPPPPDASTFVGDGAMSDASSMEGEFSLPPDATVPLDVYQGLQSERRLTEELADGGDAQGMEQRESQPMKEALTDYQISVTNASSPQAAEFRKAGERARGRLDTGLSGVSNQSASRCLQVPGMSPKHGGGSFSSSAASYGQLSRGTVNTGASGGTQPMVGAYSAVGVSEEWENFGDVPSFKGVPTERSQVPAKKAPAPNVFEDDLDVDLMMLQ